MGRVLGLDLGTTSTKAVLIDEGFQGVRLRKLYHLKNSSASLVEQLEVFFESLGPGDEFDRLVLALNWSSGSARVVELPFEDNAKVRSILPFELESEFADGTENKSFSFHRIPDRSGSDLFSYLCLGVESSWIAECLEGLKQVHYLPYQLEYAAFANHSVLALCEAQKIEGLQLFLDVGATCTGMSLVKNGELCFLRSIFLGGDDFTRSVATALNLEFEKAEDWKFEYGLSHDNREEDESTIQQALSASLDALIREIQLTLGCYYSDHGYETLGGVSVVGGGALLKGFDLRLEEVLQTPVKILNPLDSLKTYTTLPEVPTLYALALGTALRGVGIGKFQHNFMPSKWNFDPFFFKRLARHFMVVCFLGLAYLLSMGGALAAVYFRLEKLQVRYKEETQAILEQQKENFKSLGDLQKKIRERKKLLEQFSRAEKSPLHVLDFLSTQAFVDMDLQLLEAHLDNDGGESHILLKGTVPRASDIQKLENLLKTLPGLQTVTVGPVEQSQETARYLFKEIDLVL
jgi:cell division ATPase FtsA